MANLTIYDDFQISITLATYQPHAAPHPGFVVVMLGEFKRIYRPPGSQTQGVGNGIAENEMNCITEHENEACI